MNFLPTSVEKAVLHLFEDLATPISLKVSILWRYGEWDQLAAMRLGPEHYLEAEHYWRDSVAVNLVRKLRELPTSHDRKAVAEENFLLAEKQCFRSNLRLLPYLSPGLPGTDEDVCAFLGKARKIAAKILGPCPYLVEGRHGKGATYSDRGAYTTVPHKMSTEPTITPHAWPYHFQWLGTLWSKAVAVSGKGPMYVQGNRFTTVPKDSEKDRGIAVEPSINIFYQLGYGRAIRHRLRAAGINLRLGQEIHKQVACEASISGALATMDLSNASDTVCSNLVKLLLPANWFESLNDLRSKKTLFQGRWHLLEKFSSMGNGFTFELETLVFATLILALDPTGDDLALGKNVYVYGDDIIVPTAYSKAVIAMLSFFGMSVNKRKTFVDGPFRESCGGDYFLGVDVRPHHLEDSPNEPQQLISLANGLKRSCKADQSRAKSVRRAWFGVLDGLPSHIRSCRGPSDLGDLCVHDDETRWRIRWRNSIRYIKVYRPAKYRKVPWSQFRPDVTLASALLGVPSGTRGSEPLNGGVIPRDAVLGYKLGWVPYS